ncbi:hypothetical protein LCGC14_1179790 [marine sediment metagenome]|uniref:Uncharacterized protein n=1 Tax=marine sediment metagenome TaxID=412755 RepID=A0A0F9PT10_9ZZZZ
MDKGFKKHTDLELLDECWNCISDLLDELGDDCPKPDALLNELKRRCK